MACVQLAIILSIKKINWKERENELLNLLENSDQKTHLMTAWCLLLVEKILHMSLMNLKLNME